MTWLDRLLGRAPREEVRAITGGPFSVPFDQGGPLSPTAMTQERALSLPAMFAALRIISGTVSTLPLNAYRRIGDTRQPMGSLPQLFDQLVQDGQLVPWVHRCVFSLAARGNAVGLVTQRDGYQFPTAITWLNPAEVYCDESKSTARPDWYWNARLVPREDIVHIPWFPMPGRVWALSPIGAFAETIGTGLHAQDYGNSWFEGGGFPPGTMKNTTNGEVPQATAEQIKNRITSAIQSRRPVVFGADWEYTPITVPPNEAQFIQTMQLSATQVANVYGLVPEDIGGIRGKSLEYSTVEMNALERVASIRPWLVILESVFASLLPDRQYVKFNADALVRADLKTRWAVHQVAVGMGARSIDEVRALEDEPPLPNGQGRKYEKTGTAAPAIGSGEPGTDPTDPTARRTGTGREIWSIPA